MAQHNFLEFVLPSRRSDLSIDRIPSEQELMRRAAALQEIGDRLDLPRLAPADQQELTGAATVEEMEQSLAYARLCEHVPELLEMLGLPATLLRDAVGVDLALGQAQEAVRQVQAGTRVGCLLLSAEITSDCDQVEEAVGRAEQDSAVPEAERVQLQAVFANAAGVRQADLQRKEQRQRRRQLRQERLTGAVQAAEERQRLLLSQEGLKTAPLPAAPRSRRRRGDEKGKP